MTVAMMQTRIDSLRVEVEGLREQQRQADAAVAARLAEVEAAHDTLWQSAGTPDLPVVGDTAADAGLLTDPGADLGDDERMAGELRGDLFSAAASADHGDPPPGAGDSSGGERPTSYVYGLDEPPGATTGVALSEAERLTASRIRNMEMTIRSLQVEIHKKFAIASASLVFVLIGVPLALRFQRGGIGMVIALSLGIFGIYYVGLIGGETLGDEGYVPPGLAMWATNIIFGALGLVGFMRLGREQGTNRGSGWGELPAWLKLPRFGRNEPAEVR